MVNVYIPSPLHLCISTEYMCGILKIRIYQVKMIYDCDGGVNYYNNCYNVRLCYSHFIDEEMKCIEVKQIFQGHIAS